MSWRGIVTALLLVGAAISGWSLWNQRSEEPALGPSSGRPDYVLNQFELVVLDEQGEETFTLRAPMLARDPTSQTMEVATPLFLIPPSAGSSGDAWQVRSRTGWVSAEGNELRLIGEVTAISDGSTGPPVAIATEQLNVFPETKRISSAVAVSVNQPGSILRAHGLEADLDTKLYTLQSRVRWHHAPTR